jgi:hypothetical protein
VNLRKDHYRLDCMSCDVRVLSRIQTLRLLGARRVRDHAHVSKLTAELVYER